MLQKTCRSLKKLPKSGAVFRPPKRARFLDSKSGPRKEALSKTNVSELLASSQGTETAAIFRPPKFGQNWLHELEK